MESNTLPESLTYNTSEPIVTEGLRYDSGKLRFDLIPPEADIALAEILTFGARKYADRNWELGMDWSRCVASLKRHLSRWESGEVTDPETGKPHLWHLLCNVAFLVTYAERNIGTNDIPAYNRT